MVKQQRCLKVAVLTAVVALGLSAAAAPAGGHAQDVQELDPYLPYTQAPDATNTRIAELEALVAERDELIVDQEELLNAYRCMFNIDTQIVPYPCPNEDQPSPTQNPQDQAAEPVIPAGTTAEQWEQLRSCESNGNYMAYNPAGPYLGAFQFLQSTWDGVAQRNHPHLVGQDPREVAPADQHRMAYALYSERGWTPWPACTAAFRSG